MEISIESIVKIYVFSPNYFSIIKRSTTMLNHFSSMFSRKTIPMVVIFSAIFPRKNIVHKNTIFLVLPFYPFVNDVVMVDFSLN